MHVPLSIFLRLKFERHYDPPSRDHANTRRKAALRTYDDLRDVRGDVTCAELNGSSGRFIRKRLFQREHVVGFNDSREFRCIAGMKARRPILGDLPGALSPAPILGERDSRRSSSSCTGTRVPDESRVQNRPIRGQSRTREVPQSGLSSTSDMAKLVCKEVAGRMARRRVLRAGRNIPPLAADDRNTELHWRPPVPPINIRVHQTVAEGTTFLKPL